MQTTPMTSLLVESADTAIRTRGILRILQKQMQPPHDTNQVIDRGINLLERALNGNSFITSHQSQQLQASDADLSPLCWAADGYIIQTKPAPGMEFDYEGLQKHLTQVLTSLKQVKQDITNGEFETLANRNLNFIESFFSALVHIVTQQADLALSSPSKPLQTQ